MTFIAWAYLVTTVSVWFGIVHWWAFERPQKKRLLAELERCIAQRAEGWKLTKALLGELRTLPPRGGVQ